MMNNVIINIPHSSYKLPDEFKRRLLINDDKLKEELRILTDSFTDKLFYNENCYNLICEYSRLYCDVERFKDDAIELMSQRGMGAVYERTTDGEKLIETDMEYKESIIKNYYDDYHNRLHLITDKILGRNEQCIIIDGHSFSEEWVKLIGNFDGEYPDICIGYDMEFCNDYYLDALKEIIKKYNFSYAENFPFAGSIVPELYYLRKDKRVISVMIEINKKIYMDENMVKNDKFDVLKDMIQEYIRVISKSEEF